MSAGAKMASSQPGNAGMMVLVIFSSSLIEDASLHARVAFLLCRSQDADVAGNLPTTL
jgi:hypothetical protein